MVLCLGAGQDSLTSTTAGDVSAHGWLMCIFYRKDENKYTCHYSIYPYTSIEDLFQERKVREQTSVEDILGLWVFSLSNACERGIDILPRSICICELTHTRTKFRIFRSPNFPEVVSRVTIFLFFLLECSSTDLLSLFRKLSSFFLDVLNDLLKLPGEDIQFYCYSETNLQMNVVF